VQNVTDDRDPQIGEIPLVVADCEHVEQTLRGVRMAAVSGVDHVNIGCDMAGNQVRGTALGMADDEHVRVHGREVGDGIEQGLALGLR